MNVNTVVMAKAICGGMSCPPGNRLKSLSTQTTIAEKAPPTTPTLTFLVGTAEAWRTFRVPTFY